MADEFHNQSGICSGNWWNSERNGLSLPFSTAPNDVGISYGTWGNTTDHHHHQMSSEQMKSRISSDESSSISGSSSNIVYHHQDAQKQQESDSVGEGGGSSILMDSTLQMMGFGLSSSSSCSLDWNQNYISNNNRSSSGRADDHQVLLKEWSLKNFNGGGGGGGGGEDSGINGFKQINHGFALDHQQHPLSSGDRSSECTVTCEGLPTSFPMDSTLYGCPSTLLQGLFEPDHHLQPQQTTSYENPTVNNCHNPSLTNYFMSNSNDLSSTTTSNSWSKFPHQFLKTTSPPKQQPSNNNNQSLHFSNKAPFWNASAAAMANGRSSFFPSQQIQFLTSNFEEKPNCSNHTVSKPKAEEVRDSSSVMKKSSNEPSFKRPKIETPSPLPTFKVRKEKLGDRITALQQLVSPFGKTDTASVLFEAIEYIKFLHDQVGVLSAPYLKNGAHMQHHQQNSNKTKEAQGTQQDLRSRGLCLVPISSTFPVTNETATDFWTPTFGGTYR
ncbi:Myc-type [Macleaya cordata]|uniref:Myc-type n=1 Tax=Macleaya cordata TaxID=56857 RepID=A0A200Q4Y0_MACCD|nr:Myc-type [Macleaya cordata]